METRAGYSGQLHVECGQCGHIIAANTEDELVQRFREHLWQWHVRYMSEDSVRGIIREKVQVVVGSTEA